MCVAVRWLEPYPKLTEFQQELLAELAESHTDERYLAGGAALHFAPNSTRYGDDLDFEAFVMPEPGVSGEDVTPHFGAPGGVVPRVVEG